MASCKNSSSMDAPARDENGAALLSSGATAAVYGNDDTGAAAAYLYHPGATTTKGQDEHGAARAFSGSRPASATTLIDGGAADLFPDARTAAQTKADDAACLYASVHADADASQVKNSAPTVLISDVGVRAADLFPDARTAAQTKADDAACLYPSVHDADADASQVKKNSAPTVLISDVGVRAAAQDEDAKVYLDFDTLAAAKNRHAAAAGQRGVFGGETTSAPAVAVVGQEKLAEAFAEPERLRRELPVLGLSLASLAVAGLAAGEPTPAVGFGLFLMLIVGLSAVTIRALRDY